MKDVSLLLLDAIRRNERLPQALKPTPLGDIDTEDRQDAFNVSSEDDDTPDNVDQHELLDAVLPDEDEDSPQASHTVKLGVVGLPLAGVVARTDGVPTAQAPDGAAFKIVQAADAPQTEDAPAPAEKDSKPEADSAAQDTLPEKPGLALAGTTQRTDGVPAAVAPGETQQQGEPQKQSGTPEREDTPEQPADTSSQPAPQQPALPGLEIRDGINPPPDFRSGK